MSSANLIKENYVTRLKKTALSITNGKITAVQKSDIAKTGLRLYENGCIGVSGALGSYDENKLFNNAKNMLNFKVPYDCAPTENIVRTVDLTDRLQLTDEQFVEKSKQLLDMLAEKFPDFMFSHKISLQEQETSLKNDVGASLLFKDKMATVLLSIKHKLSKNLDDYYGFYQGRVFDVNEVFNTVTQYCPHHDDKADITEGKMPVVFLDEGVLLLKFYNDLHGRIFGTGSSLFTGKIGQKAFNEGFSFGVDRNSIKAYTCFFDAEGTTLENDKFMLVENGVLKSPFTSKKVAKKYGYANTGCAYGEYDSVPSTFYDALSVSSSGKTIKELVNGRKSILVAVTSGGDFTPQGEFAAPVQAAFYFDGEKISGRLPQIAVTSNVFDMYGNDFIGRSSDGNSPNNYSKYMAMEMNVRKIGDWM